MQKNLHFSDQLPPSWDNNLPRIIKNTTIGELFIKIHRKGSNKQNILKSATRKKDNKTVFDIHTFFKEALNWSPSQAISPSDIPLS